LVDCAIGSSALLLLTLAARATAHGGKVDGLVDGLDHRFHRPSGVGHWRACLGGMATTLDDKDLRPAGVLPIGISVTTGSYPIGVPQPWTKYLYAWGRVTYVDGFGNERWTNFCHRYNTEVKEAQIGGGNRIRKEYGRHHEYGNDAN
jgi:hypothetical protein